MCLYYFMFTLHLLIFKAYNNYFVSLLLSNNINFNICRNLKRKKKEIKNK